MAEGGYLVPPSQDTSKERIWVETRRRLERFLPNLFPELFPEASAQDISSRPLSMPSSPIATAGLPSVGADNADNAQEQAAPPPPEKATDDDEGEEAPATESDAGAQEGEG